MGNKNKNQWEFFFRKKKKVGEKKYKNITEKSKEKESKKYKGVHKKLGGIIMKKRLQKSLLILKLIFSVNFFFLIKILNFYFEFVDIGEVNATIPMMAEHLATTSMSHFCFQS